MSTSTPSREKSLGTVSPADISIEELPVVELTSDQLRRADSLAERRQESYKRINGGCVFGSNASLTNHQIGILGELAVATRYDTEIDTDEYAFGDDGTDLPLGPLTVDVKATATEKMRLPQLLVRADKKLSADLYFRVHVLDWGPSGAHVRLIGWTSASHIRDRESRPHPGDTENYVVEPEELTLPSRIRR